MTQKDNAQIMAEKAFLYVAVFLALWALSRTVRIDSLESYVLYVAALMVATTLVERRKGGPARIMGFSTGLVLVETILVGQVRMQASVSFGIAFANFALFVTFLLLRDRAIIWHDNSLPERDSPTPTGPSLGSRGDG